MKDANLLKAEKLLNDIPKLPTLPDVYMHVKDAVADPRMTASKLGEIILTDQGIAVQVLRLANSAYYALRKEVKSITQSISMLGFNVIHDFVLSVALMGIFPEKDDPDSPFSMLSYWEHSIAVAQGSKIIAEKINYAAPETAFVSGLIHDMGRLLMYAYFADEFKAAITYAKEQDISMVVAEDKFFDVTHNELGYALAKKWDLPEFLGCAMAYHHEPIKVAKFDSMIPTTIVHVANCLAIALELGYSGDTVIPQLSQAACDRIQLSPSYIGPIMRLLENDFYHVKNAILDSSTIG